jgi:hypothetical protein
LASDLTITTIKIPVWLWAGLIFDLRRRGNGVRESGAFLLGRDDRAFNASKLSNTGIGTRKFRRA